MLTTVPVLVYSFMCALFIPLLTSTEHDACDAQRQKHGNGNPQIFPTSNVVPRPHCSCIPELTKRRAAGGYRHIPVDSTVFITETYLVSESRRRRSVTRQKVSQSHRSDLSGPRLWPCAEETTEGRYQPHTERAEGKTLTEVTHHPDVRRVSKVNEMTHLVEAVQVV